MLEFPFIGGTIGAGSDDNDSLAFSPQRTVNMYPELNPQYKNGMVLHGFPGFTQFVDLGNEIRGGITFKDHAVVVAGNAIYKITAGGAKNQLGSISTSSGLVSMDENGLEMMLVDGTEGYIWDGTKLSIITDPTFTQTKADSVTYLDTAFIINRPGTGQIFASDSLDGINWTATKTATAEFKSDPVIVVWTDRELFLGGTKTIQVYWNRGSTPMPFEPLREGRMIYGIAAKNSVAVMDNTTHALFRDENGGVFVGKLNGYTPQRISPDSLNRFWASIDYQDAFAFPLHWKGHEFYIITFPAAETGRGRTFAYDASTKLWFELGKWLASIGDFERWSPNFHIFFDKKNLVGGEDGVLYYLDDSSYTYGSGNEIVSLRRAPVIHNHRERVFHDKLQIDMDVGHGLNSGQGSSPLCRLEISDDGGRSFKNFRDKSIGQTGKHEQRVQFHQLGSSYDRVYQVSVSDPVPRRWISGYVEGG